MADQEKIQIRLGLSGTYWDKKPQYRISFNDSVLKEGFITAPSGEVEIFNFDVDYETDEGTIKVELLNKTPEDTKKDNYDDPNNFKIVADMLLNIVSLEIDDIDLAQIPYKHGVYTTKTPVIYKGSDKPTTTILECTNMGWNGAWSLTWTNPFYLWLLETM
jgi:hypothetical protein